jgi:dihydrolipoamide dehydrogenase
MVIIGSGAIGMEFAYFYNAFGTKVTVVEMVDRILPIEDEDISKLALRSFTKQGMTFHVGHTVKAATKSAKGVKVTIVDVNDEKKTQDLECETLLVAIGVAARMDGLCDDKLGLKVEKGYIVTDYKTSKEPSYKTSVPGVYAIGDIIGPPWLAHVASEEAVTCVERMAGHHTLGIDYNMIPGCTYCNPQIASVGLTEAKAKEQGRAIKVGRFPFAGNGKAIALGEPEGLVKTIFDAKTGQLIGAHMVGAEVTELIQGFVIAMDLETTEEDLMHTVFPHPTLSEMMHESVLDAYGRVIHT